MQASQIQKGKLGAANCEDLRIVIAMDLEDNFKSTRDRVILEMKTNTLRQCDGVDLG